MLSINDFLIQRRLKFAIDICLQKFLVQRLLIKSIQHLYSCGSDQIGIILKITSIKYFDMRIGIVSLALNEIELIVMDDSGLNKNKWIGAV